MMMAMTIAHKLQAALHMSKTTTAALPDDQELVFPRAQSAANVTDAEADESTYRDSYAIRGVPVSYDRRLLLSREPHAGDRDAGSSDPTVIVTDRWPTHKQGSATASNIPDTNRNANIASYD